MAAGGSRRPGDSPWWVTGLKVAAGIGAAALGAYAAAKAAESFQEEEPMRSQTHSAAQEKSGKSNKCKPSDSDDSDDGNGDDHWVDINDDDEYSDSSASDQDTPPSPSKPMIEQLQEYYEDKVKVAEEEVTAMKAVVEQVARCISEYIRGRGGNLLQGDAYATGSSYEGTAVQHPDRFAIIVPLRMEPDMWKAIKCPGYSLVQRINTDRMRPGTSVWDKYLLESYLNPEYVLRFLERVLNKVDNKGFTFSYTDSYVVKSAIALTLEVIYPVGGMIEHLAIEIIPSITVEDAGGKVCLDGVPYGSLSASVDGSRQDKERSRRDSDPYENLWQQSMRTQEAEMIRVLEEDGGCRRKILQILKAVCCNQSPLTCLAPYLLKTVFLHMCDEESEWEEVMMVERFFDVVKRLEQFLEEQYLPHFFHREVNLFEGFSSSQLSKARKYLTKRLNKPGRIDALLV